MTNPNYPIRPQPNARMTDYEKVNPYLPIALRVSGKLYPTYVFREMPYGRVINKYYRPYNPQTEKQQNWRQNYTDALTNWQGFDDITKNFYNKMKWPPSLYGYHRYIRLYLLSKK
jgi:hypothetical protein